MKTKDRETIDLEQFKGEDGNYHLENLELSETQLEELFKTLTSDDEIIITQSNKLTDNK